MSAAYLNDETVHVSGELLWQSGLLASLGLSIALPVLFVAIGVMMGHKLINLGAALVIWFAMSLATLALAVMTLIFGLADPLIALAVLILCVIFVLLPLAEGKARQKTVSPVDDEEEPANDLDDDLTDDGIEEISTVSGSGFSCVPTIVKKIGDPDKSKNKTNGKDAYWYHPYAKNYLPRTVYAYRWQVTFKRTTTSFFAEAKMVGYIHPWYRPSLMGWEGPYTATSKGSAAIVCTKTSSGCAASAINTKPDSTVKGEYSSGVVVSSKASGANVTVEGSATVSLKGNVTISGVTAGATGGGANVGVTLTVPNTAVDTENFNQSVLYTCKKVAAPTP